MPLKFKYGAKEQIPAEHVSLYVERDGAFVLDLRCLEDERGFVEQLARLDTSAF